MSNVKPTVEMVVGQPEESSGNRGPFRRNSRSAQLESPIMAAGDLEEQSVVSSSSPEPNARVTRSQSIESSVEPIETKKRHRKTRGPGNNKRKAETNGKSTSGRDDTDRETRNKTQRISKEAREARKAEREIIIKERLAELDKLEKAVKNESHAEYHKLLRDIEAKRTKKVNATESRHSLAEMNIRSAFIAQKKVAFDQFYLDKLTLRRSMMQQVQKKINMLEQEYYSQHVQSSLDNQHLADWVPPERPSMISSLTLGLDEDDIQHDLKVARQDPTAAVEDRSDTVLSYHYPSHSSPPLPKREHTASPPPEMLASRADHQQSEEENSMTTEQRSLQRFHPSSQQTLDLPPLNPWRVGYTTTT